ncbi:hypothetical protein ACFLYO_04130 [Chloroflexota bacterium]
MAHYNIAPPAGTTGVAVLTGQRPLLISAPHATRHWRRNAWKSEDEYTAAWAYWLHEQTGAHALIATHRLNPDPHDDDDRSRYKQILGETIRAHDIRLVLDLHGARGDRDFGVALGTINGQTCQPYEDNIVLGLERAGVQRAIVAPSLDRLVLNTARYAGGTHQSTVTRYVWGELGVPAIQIEVNEWVRIVERLPTSYHAEHRIAPDFRGDPVRIARVLTGLRDIIETIIE